MNTRKTDWMSFLIQHIIIYSMFFTKVLKITKNFQRLAMETIGKANISSKFSKRRLVLIKALICCSFSNVLFQCHIISIFKHPRQHRTRYYYYYYYYYYYCYYYYYYYYYHHHQKIGVQVLLNYIVVVEV